MTCRFRPLSLVSPSPSNESLPAYGWALCTSPATFSGLAEGRWGLTLRATDNAGLSNETAEAQVFIMLTRPRVNVTSGPPRWARQGLGSWLAGWVAAVADALAVAAVAVTGCARGRERVARGGRRRGPHSLRRPRRRSPPVPSTVSFTLVDATGLPAGTRPDFTTFQMLVRPIDQATFWQLGNSTAAPSSGAGRRLLARVAQRALGGGAAAVAGRGSGQGGGAARRRLLQSPSPASGSSGTTLDSGFLGSWANCSSPCTYTGLPSGYYAFSARQVDAAGNVGNATSAAPFQVDASLDGGSGGLPTWAIIVIAVGGAVVAVAAVVLLVWCCCKRKRGSRAAGGAAGGATLGASAGAPPSWGYQPPRPGAGVGQQQHAAPPYGGGGGYPVVAGEGAAGRWQVGRRCCSGAPTAGELGPTPVRPIPPVQMPPTHLRWMPWRHSSWLMRWPSPRRTLRLTPSWRQHWRSA